MQLSGERTIPASRQAVWVAMNDPATLCRCLPGCERVERVTDVEFALVARLPAEPAGATSRGTIRLSDVDPPAGFRFEAELRSEGGVRTSCGGRDC